MVNLSLLGLTGMRTDSGGFCGCVQALSGDFSVDGKSWKANLGYPWAVCAGVIMRTLLAISISLARALLPIVSVTVPTPNGPPAHVC